MGDAELEEVRRVVSFYLTITNWSHRSDELVSRSSNSSRAHVVHLARMAPIKPSRRGEYYINDGLCSAN